MDGQIGAFQSPMAGKSPAVQPISPTAKDYVTFGQATQDVSQARQQREAELAGNVPAAPSIPTEQHKPNIKAYMGLAGAMMLLSALGGRHTSAPMTAAMNNMSASLKGLHEGNAEVQQSNDQQMWQNFNAAMAAHKQGLEEYKAAIDEMYKDPKYGQNAVYLKMLERGMKPEVAAMFADPKSAAQIYDSSVKAMAHAQEVALRLKASGAVGALGDTTAHAIAAEVIAGATKQQIGMTYGRAALANWDKVQALAVQQYMNDNPGATPEDAGRAIIEAQTTRGVSTQAEKSIAVREAGVSAIQNRLISHGNMALQLAKQYGAQAGIPSVNMAELQARRAAGDPGATKVLAQIYLFQQELARMSAPGSNAQLHEGAREEAQQILQPGFTIDQLGAMIDLVRQDAQMSKDAFSQERQSLKEERVPQAIAGAPKQESDPLGIR